MEKGKGQCGAEQGFFGARSHSCRNLRTFLNLVEKDPHIKFPPEDRARVQQLTTYCEQNNMDPRSCVVRDMRTESFFIAQDCQKSAADCRNSAADLRAMLELLT